MYESDWVNVYLDDVELPDGSHIDHHVLTMPKASQTAVVVNAAGDQVLLIWRHRFITDTWGWEVPAGWVEPGESSEDAIRREILEETGHSVNTVSPMVSYYAIPGISTMKFTAWIASGGSRVRSPNSEETVDVAWHSTEDLRDLVAAGEITDGPSLTSLSYWLALPTRTASS
jgi:8-oxo-dGTP pyrophosphatase MutT (NUDIX family)